MSNVKTYFTQRYTIQSNPREGVQKKQLFNLSALWATGALRRRLLHRNGNFATPSPRIRTRQWVKTSFRRKTGCSRAVYDHIRKIPIGKTTEILMSSQALIRFFSSIAWNGPFWPFFWPQGPKMGNSLLIRDPEGATRRLSRVHPGYPFPIWLLGFKSENAIWARFGFPRAKTRFGKRLKMANYEWIRITSRGEMTVLSVASQPLPNGQTFWTSNKQI